MIAIQRDRLDSLWIMHGRPDIRDVDKTFSEHGRHAVHRKFAKDYLYAGVVTAKSPNGVLKHTRKCRRRDVSHLDPAQLSALGKRGKFLPA